MQRYQAGAICAKAILCLVLLISCAPAQAQEPASPTPPQPANTQPGQKPPAQADEPKDDKHDEDKKTEPSPAQAIADKTREVAEATRNLGTAALLKARDWESGWLTGVYVDRDHPLVPVTDQQRRRIYFEQTLATPGAYMKRMFAAGIDQFRGAPPQWDDGWGGYAERFASREGQFISANSLAALRQCRTPLRTPLRPVPLPRLLAPHSPRHPAQLSYLQSQRAATPPPVGPLRRILRRRTHLYRLEAPSPQRLRRRRRDAPVGAEDIRDLHGGANHAPLRCRGWARLQWTDHLAQDLGRDMGVERCCLELLVAEQHLDHSDIHLLFEQVGGEAVP